MLSCDVDGFQGELMMAFHLAVFGAVILCSGLLNTWLFFLMERESHQKGEGCIC